MPFTAMELERAEAAVGPVRAGPVAQLPTMTA